MKYEIKPSSRFKRDMKLVKKRGYDQRLIENVIRTLAAGEELDKKYRDHLLLGDYAGFHECHITPDWLLIYQIYEEELYLLLLHVHHPFRRAEISYSSCFGFWFHRNRHPGQRSLSGDGIRHCEPEGPFHLGKGGGHHLRSSSPVPGGIDP